MNTMRESAVAQIEAAAGQMREAVEQVLAASRDAKPKDTAAADVVLEVLRAVGVVAQAAHGMTLQLAAQADRLKATRGGVGPWLATHLDCSESRARGLALEARMIGALPSISSNVRRTIRVPRILFDISQDQRHQNASFVGTPSYTESTGSNTVGNFAGRVS